MSVIVKILELDRAFHLESLYLLYYDKNEIINFDIKMFILTLAVRLIPMYDRHYLKFANGRMIPLSPIP